MGEGAVSVGRLVLICLAVGLGVTSLVLTGIAIMTPNWQTVFLKEFHTEHLHGLWLDCTRTVRFIQSQGYPPSDAETHCAYKFQNAEYFPDSSSTVHGEEEQHKFQDWHKAVLAFFVVAITCGFAALCFTLCAASLRISAIVASVLNLCAFLSSFVGFCVFFIHSHRTEVRYVQGLVTTYEQSKGYSFYLSLCGVVGFMLTFMVGVIATVLVFVHERNQQRANTNSSSANNSNSNGRQRGKMFRTNNVRDTHNGDASQPITTISSIAV